MRWSTLFIPTLREHPAQAETVSHQLLLRAGYIRRLSADIYSHLLLGHRCLSKIQQIVREEMNVIGGQEVLLPALNPAEPGMSQEEAVTFIARGELRSYKQLPQIWYQIQIKFSDEPRPKSGLPRVRQFMMKDSYTFDLDAAGLDAAYRKHHDTYRRILDRCGLPYMIVEAHSNATGGNESHEFVVRSDAGEDFVVKCPACGYATNMEKAISQAAHPELADPEGDCAPEEFHTPNLRTIADLSAFMNLPESSQMKSLVMVADETPILVMLRGDHQLAETKLQNLLRSKELRPAHPEEILDLFGASAGSLGPLGVRNMRILADLALKGRRNMICGANRDDYHLKNVTPGKDFQPEYFDLRQACPGDGCANCGGRLEMVKAVEIGHLFKLGDKYSQSMGLRVLGEDGKEVSPLMGSYGIGIERILTCAVELFNDKDGMILPPAIAPFTVVITPVNYQDPLHREAADQLYVECRQARIDALIDDRDERPGVKFKDADLIGIPYRITVGKKLRDARVEFTSRRARTSEDVRLDKATDHLRQQISAEASVF
ncbi:MAG TPA: proline--tRNA ligase [Bryobacteraceae bacterium]